jgi:two-component system sensor histidine kinase KdpD
MVKSRFADDDRPDPDALLAQSEKDKKGRLKVFLGAAPGVGKTYAMLQGAKRLSQEGADVVIGLAETHGRKETLALMEGLELLPQRPIDYHGRVLSEFDLDAALARKPDLIIVDELAHSNAPDCRHPKRWQDVDELLDAGINVWTALNIQHLEGLADVVSGITGVVVRETVPDTVLKNASEIVLVDITSNELINRLKEGKIYLPETAQRATQNFFTEGNLTVLRELALRRTADRIDDDVASFRQQKIIGGPWGGGERLLVCVGRDAGSEKLVRYTSRLATQAHASWVAVHLDHPDSSDGDAAALRKVTEVLQLAERLGGQTVQLISQDFTADLLKFARKENVTQIIIGRAQKSFFARIFRKTLADDLIRSASDIGVQVLAGESEVMATPRPHILIKWPKLFWEVTSAIIATASAVVIGELLGHLMPLPNLSMIFLAAVNFCALRFGMRAAILTSLLSFGAYNFFFIEPIYTFSVAEPHELFALFVFLIVSIFSGSLAGRFSEQSIQIQRRAGVTEALYDFSRKLSAVSKIDDILWVAATHGARSLGGHIVFLMPVDDDLETKVIWPPDEDLEEGDLGAARWAWQKGESAGLQTNTLPRVRFQYRALSTPRGVVGVVGYRPPQPQSPLSVEQERGFSAIIDQTAIAVDRSLLVDETIRVATLEENEKIRTSVFASISHDLRTPLASITGAVTTLQSMGDQLSAERRHELLLSIEQESGRLSRFVSNLLDMSQLEAGSFNIQNNIVDVADTIRMAVARMKQAYLTFSPIVTIDRNLPFIHGDTHFLEQAIFNLLDNAHKHGQGAAVKIEASRFSSKITVSISDEGPGIAPGDMAHIFDKFYRGQRSDGRVAGTGLGLAISKGFVEAMGGAIEVQSPIRGNRGTRMTLTFAINPIEKGTLSS